MPSDVLITPASSKIDFTDGNNSTKRLNISGTAFNFNSNLNVLSSTSLGSAFKAEGVNGTLFEVTDDLSNSLMSVNTIGGLPVFEVFANNSIIGGQYGANDFVISGNKIGLGLSNPVNKLSVSGAVSIGASYNVAAPSNGLIVQGDVGIGVTSFAFSSANRANLEMYGSSESLLALRNSTGNSYIQKSGADFYINNVTNGFIAISNNGSERWRITNAGVFESNNAQTIRTSTGNLTLATNAGNGHIILSPHGTGNVGIGIATPTAVLNVKTSTQPNREVFMGDSAAVSGVFRARLDDNSLSFIQLENRDTASTTNHGVGIRFNLSTNVSNNSIDAGGVYLVKEQQWTATTSTQDSALRFFTTLDGAASEKLRIQSDGNVGIGTTSATAKLEVDGSIYLGGNIRNRWSTNIWTVAQFPAASSTSPTYFMGFTTDPVNRIFYISNKNNDGSATDPNGSIIFRTGTTPSDRMLISYTGNVGIGTINPGRTLEVSLSAAGDAGGYLRLRNPNTTINTETGIEFFNTTSTTNTDAGAAIRAIRQSATNTSDLTISTTANSNLTEKLRITSTGNVGIGTTSPVQKLELHSTVGNPYTSGVNQDGIMRFSNTTDNAVFDIGMRGGGAGAWLQSTDKTNLGVNYPLLLNPNGGNVSIGALTASNKLHVNGSVSIGSNYNTAATTNGLIVEGNVGIGITGPTAKLDVEGTNVNGYSLLLRSGDNYNGTDSVQIAFGFANQTNYRHSIRTRHNPLAPIGGVVGNNIDFYVWKRGTDAAANLGSQFVMTMQGDGAVGIGTTNPLSPLEIYKVPATSTTLQTMLTINTDFASASGTGFGGSIVFKGRTAGNVLQDNAQISAYNEDIGDNGYALGFYTRPTVAGGLTQRMTILRGGNVGIGTISPSAKLEISGSSGATTQAIFQSNDSNGSVAYLGGIQLGNAASNQNSQIYHNSSGDNTLTFASNYSSGTANKFVFAPGGTERVRFQQNGNVGLGVQSTNATLHIKPTTLGANGLILERYASTAKLVYMYEYAADGYIEVRSGADVIVSKISGYVSTPTYFQSSVGIGTTSPATLLQINTGTPTAATGGIQFGDDTGARLYRIGSGTCQFAGALQVSSYIYTATYFQTNLGQIKSDSSFALLTTGNGAQSVSAKGILLGTSYDTAPGANEIRTTNNTSLYLNARGTGDIQFQTADSLKMMLLNNGDVGIGISSPAARLHVNSTTSGATLLRADGTNGTLFSVVDDLSDSLMSVNNSAGLPVLEVFADDRVVAGQYGANDFVITGNKVGVGTANPSFKLDVNGTLGVNAGTSDGNWPFIVVDTNTAGGTNRYALNKIGAMGFNYPDSYAQLQLVGANGAYIDFNNAAVDDFDARIIYYSNSRFDIQYGTVMTINSTGVGIGTTSPGYLFAVNNGSDVWHAQFGQVGGNQFRIGGNTTNGAVIGAYANNSNNNPRQLLLNRDGGNVGIGVSNALNKLHVYSSVAGSGSERTTPVDVLTLESENTTAQEFTGFGQVIIFRGSTYNNNTQRTLGKIIHQINDDSVSTTRGTSLDFQLLTDATGSTLASRMYIKYDGNVGIGNTNPTSKLQVTGGIQFGYGSDSVFYTGTEFDSSKYLILQNNTDSYGRIGLAINAKTFNGANTPSTNDGWAMDPRSGIRFRGWLTGDSGYDTKFVIQHLLANATNAVGDFGIFAKGFSTTIPAFVLTGGGRIGISTTTPAALLQIGTGTPTSVTDGIQFGSDVSARLYRTAPGVITCPGTIAATFSGSLTGNVTGTASGNLTSSSTLTAGNLSGTIPSAVLGNSSVFIGTTSIALNRGSAALTLSGVNISGTAASETFATVTGRGSSTTTQISVGTTSSGSMYTGIKSGAGYSDTVSGATFKSITDHPTGGSFAFAAYYNGAPGTGTNSFYVAANGGAYFAQGVGIGVTPPLQALHVNGNIILDGVTNGYTQGATRGIGYGSNNGGVSVNGFSGMDIQSVNAPAPNNGNYSQNLRFWTHHYGTGSGGTPRMFIQYDGNVGIGSLAPSAKLNVLSSTSLSSVFKAEGINGTLFEVTDDLSNSLMSVNTIGGLPVFEVFANNSIIAGQYGRNDFVISGNKIGIGTASPVYKLDVYESSSADVARFYNNSSSCNFYIGSTNNTTATALVLYTSNGNGQIFKNRSSTAWGGADSFNIYSSNGAIAFHPAGTTNAVYFATNGNVGINNINPGYKLDVNGTSVFRDTVNIGPSIGTITWGSMGGGTGFGVRAESGRALSFGAGGNFDHLVINTNGNVGIGTTAPATVLQINTGTPTAATGGIQFGNDTGTRLYRSGPATITCSGTIAGTFSGTATNATQLGGVAASSYVRNDVDGTDSTALFRLTTITKSLTVTTSWIDTGIVAADLPDSGAYILTLNVDNYAVNGGHYNETYAGIMYWYSGGTNDLGVDEIVLHKSGHAPNGKYINLRTVRQLSGGTNLKLQIISNVATNGASNYIFKFRRMI